MHGSLASELGRHRMGWGVRSLLISALEVFDDLHFCIPSLNDFALVLRALSFTFPFEISEPHRHRDITAVVGVVTFHCT
jgi:hypothetical protein